MPDPDPSAVANAIETFSAPMESVITALGRGIASAQRALDENSIQMQESIDSDPVLSQYGLQATWYQFPRVDLQLKMSIAVAEEGSTSSQPPAAGPAPAPAPTGVSIATLAAIRNVRLVAQPVSASFQTHFNYTSDAASQVTVSIVPVPAPRSGAQVTVPPRMLQAAVQQAAFGSPAKFSTTLDAHGTKVPADKDAGGNALRFDVNFNGSSRVWYVLQYAPANAAVTPVVVAIDDATGSVRVIRTP
jgi:hypothetical protein